MKNSDAMRAMDAARESLAPPFDFEDFLAKLAPKDKLNAGRRVTVLEAEPDANRARLWKRLACTLMKLAPHAAKLIGHQTVQFYVSDGRYRMQVFAIEDLKDGNFTLYCPDILDQALSAGFLARTEIDGKIAYTVAASGEAVQVEPLDANSLNPAAHYKDMTGWNRKAVRITLPPTASPTQVEAAELLCALAALRFAPVVAKALAPAAGGRAATV